jgi:UDP-N-acetyl-D-mannosaminuronate dehydrogenase
VLEQGSGLKAGEGFHLAYSPEREDPGRTDHSVKTIPKVMGGYTEACLERCVELYAKAVDKVHPVGSCRVAEATKHAAYKDIDFSGFTCPLVDTRNLIAPHKRPTRYCRA